MKVILISASPRLGGNTAQIVDQCAKTLRDNHLETEVISFHGQKIEACTACDGCKKTGRCALKDGANEMFDQIRAAQGLIVATPVYFGTARGDLMNFLQRLGRMSRGHGDFLKGMVGGPIAVARRGGQTATLQELLMFYLMNSMIVVGSTYWNMAFGSLIGEVMEDTEGVQTINNFATNVADVVTKLNQ